MPVTWCYLLGGGNQYCSTGFPMGCYVGKGFGTRDCSINVSNCVYFLEYL